MHRVPVTLTFTARPCPGAFLIGNEAKLVNILLTELITKLKSEMFAGL